MAPTANAIEHALTLFDVYALEQRRKITDGFVTPRYAADKVVKYGLGLRDLLWELYGERGTRKLHHAIDLVSTDLDLDAAKNRKLR